MTAQWREKMNGKVCALMGFPRCDYTCRLTDNVDLPNFPENGNVRKWKINYMDFPEISGKSKKNNSSKSEFVLLFARHS